MRGRRAVPGVGAGAHADRKAAVTLGSLASLAVAGLLVRAGAPGLLSGVVFFAALSLVVAVTLAAALRRER